MRCWRVLPPVMGLYASILPMIVYALAGSGRQTSVGPVTVDSLMLVLGSQHAGDGRHRFVHCAGRAAHGADRRDSAGDGRAAPGVPRQLSFVSGAGRLYVRGCGHHRSRSAATCPGRQPAAAARSCIETVTDVTHTRRPGESITIVIAVGCMVALWAIRRWAPTAPGALALVIFCTVLAYAFGPG